MAETIDFMASFLFLPSAIKRRIVERQ